MIPLFFLLVLLAAVMPKYGIQEYYGFRDNLCSHSIGHWAQQVVVELAARDVPDVPVNDNKPKFKNSSLSM